MRILDKLKPVALLLLRWGLGVIFVYHGFPKLTHTQDHVQSFVHMGFPSYFLYIAAVLETFGGLLLLAGLFTRVAALLLAGEMAVAIWKVHLPQGGIYGVENYQFPLAMAVGAFTLASFGAGLISIDYALFRGSRSSPRRPKTKD